MHYIKAIIIFCYFFSHASPHEESIKVLAVIPPHQEIVQIADANLNMDYDSHNAIGYDCSGFVQFCYNSVGIDIPRSSRKQYEQGLKISTENAMIGDIICFLGSNKHATSVGHVGIITTIYPDRIEFIHSSSSNGVIYSSSDEPYYADRFIGITRYQ